MQGKKYQNRVKRGEMVEQNPPTWWENEYHNTTDQFGFSNKVKNMNIDGASEQEKATVKPATKLFSVVSWTITTITLI